MQVSGSSAIVVGGAGRLGEATVRWLHAAGAKVVIADLADDNGKELASELDARYVRTDATNTEDVQAALAEAESFGRCASRWTPMAARPVAAGWSAKTAHRWTWTAS
jgi:NAD(P)-dependent dehydrogenase (short-subunit alcohol dehydrogenase family)